MSLAAIKADHVCDNDNDGDFNMWQQEFGTNMAQPSVINLFQMIVNGTDISKKEVCRRSIETGVSVVRILLSDTTVTEMKRQVRFSTIQLLSMIGELALVFGTVLLLYVYLLRTTSKYYLSA